ncbi:hypothetical protein GS982_20020 [Rhodococcus hoagii]|nr:hypothetical protein [Prescottella equi]NKZ84490.1 hypothetical protein [Prescottella equi]
MARVGFDLDGVLFDFTSSFRDALTELRNWPRRACPDPTRWDFYEDWGLSQKGFLDVCNEAADAGLLFRRGNLPLGAHSALKELRAAGHTVHIVTDRSFGSHPSASQEPTLAWLRENRVDYDTITFTSDKTFVNLDYMLDDRPSNVRALLSGTACDAYLRARPWNEQADGLPRVDSVGEYVQKVLTA